MCPLFYVPSSIIRAEPEKGCSTCLHFQSRVEYPAGREMRCVATVGHNHVVEFEGHVSVMSQGVFDTFVLPNM